MHRAGCPVYQNSGYSLSFFPALILVIILLIFAKFAILTGAYDWDKVSKALIIALTLVLTIVILGYLGGFKALNEYVVPSDGHYVFLIISIGLCIVMALVGGPQAHKELGGRSLYIAGAIAGALLGMLLSELFFDWHYRMAAWTLVIVCAFFGFLAVVKFDDAVLTILTPCIGSFAFLEAIIIINDASFGNFVREHPISSIAILVVLSAWGSLKQMDTSYEYIHNERKNQGDCYACMC